MINNRLCGGRCGGKAILATKTEESLPLRHITRHCEAPQVRSLPAGEAAPKQSLFLTSLYHYTQKILK